MMMMSDLFISFSYSCARISHVWRESDSHSDNLEEFIVTKRDQPQGALHCTEIADTWRKGFDSQILIASVRLRKRKKNILQICSKVFVGFRFLLKLHKDLVYK